MSELKGKIRTGIIWVILTNLGTILIQMVALYVLSRLLTAEDFGLQGIGLMLIDLTVIFTYPFINKAIIMRKDLTKEYLASATFLSLTLSTLLAFIFFITAPMLSKFWDDPNTVNVIYCICVIFIMRGIYQPNHSLLEKELRYKEISNANMFAFIVGNLIGSIVLAYNGYGYWSLLYGFLIHDFYLLLFYLYKGGFNFGIPKRESIKDIFNDSGSLIVQSAANRLASNGDILIISKFLGTSALGYYTRAYKIMKMPTNMIGSIINNLAFSSLSTVQDDDAKLLKAFSLSSYLIAIISFPISIFSMVFADEIVYIMLGEKWMTVSPVLSILAFGTFLRMSYKIPGTLIKVKQKFMKAARIQVIYAINIFVFSILLVKFGIEGVAVGTLLAILFQYLQLCYSFTKIINEPVSSVLKFLAKPLLLGVVSAAILIGIKLGMNALDHNNHFITISVGLLIISVFYLISFFKYKHIFYGEMADWWIDFIRNKKGKEGKKKKKNQKENDELDIQNT